MRRRQTCPRHALGRARNVGEAELGAAFHAVGVAALLAADAEFDDRIHNVGVVRSDLHRAAHAGLVQDQIRDTKPSHFISPDHHPFITEQVFALSSVKNCHFFYNDAFGTVVQQEREWLEESSPYTSIQQSENVSKTIIDI